MAGESELVIVAEGDTPDGGRWQVRAGGTADEYLHAWKVFSADGEWDGSGVGGPALPSDGRLVDVTARSGTRSVLPSTGNSTDNYYGLDNKNFP